MSDIITASDFWKGSRFAHVLDRGKLCLQAKLPPAETEQAIRELMTALIRSEGLIPEEEIDEHEPDADQGELLW